jgi:hypothetical protein
MKNIEIFLKVFMEILRHRAKNAIPAVLNIKPGVGLFSEQTLQG